MHFIVSGVQRREVQGERPPPVTISTDLSSIIRPFMSASRTTFGGSVLMQIGSSVDNYRHLHTWPGEFHLQNHITGQQSSATGWICRKDNYICLFSLWNGSNRMRVWIALECKDQLRTGNLLNDRTDLKNASNCPSFGAHKGPSLEQSIFAADLWIPL